MLKGTAISLLLALSLTTGTAMAETIYVNDYLRLGVRANPNSSETPIAVVTTGDTLEVLERQEGYIKVRAKNGVEGWVSKAYISSDEPAVLRLEKLQKEFQRQQGELKDLRKELSASQEKGEKLDKQLSELMSENGTLHEQVSRYYSKTAQQRQRFTWIFQSLGIVALFVFGIFLGVRWQKRRVADRLGGLEI